MSRRGGQTLRDILGVCAYVAKLHSLTGTFEYIAGSREDEFLVGCKLEEGEGVTHGCLKVRSPATPADQLRRVE